MADKNIQVKITATDESKTGLAKAAAGIKSFADNATSAFKTLIAAAAVEKIASFFTSAVEHAVEAEKSFIQVGNALKNIGVNAEAIRPQVDQFVRQISDASGIRIEDVQTAFATLIRRTGDYKTAQDLLLPTLDVAAARNLDVAKAADTVAKAHDGNAKALKIVMNTTGAASDQNTGYIKTLNEVQSKLLRSPRALCSRTTPETSHIAKRPSGMLTRKIQGQVKFVRSQPPSAGPSAGATIAAAP